MAGGEPGAAAPTAGAPSPLALPEHWTELAAAQRQKLRCAADVAALAAACVGGCAGRGPGAACADCYAPRAERIRRRYAASRDREWFSLRRAFLHELDGLFLEAIEAGRGLDRVQARIESEKEAWYRWVLRRYPDFITLGASDDDDGPEPDHDDDLPDPDPDLDPDQARLRCMLDDPDRSRSELVALMLRRLGTLSGPDGPASVLRLAAAAAAAAADPDPARLKAVYEEEFFLEPESGRPRAHVEPYLARFRAEPALGLDQVIDLIVRHLRESRSARPQRALHRRRLDELRRARTAFEQSKAEAKARLHPPAALAGPSTTASAPDQPVATGSPLYDNLPPCSVCNSPVSLSSMLSCCLCHAAAQLGTRPRPSLYCGPVCCRKGHNDHVAAEHDCEAGDDCLQLADDPRAMPDDSPPPAASCRPCLESGRMSVYCSQDCARAHQPHHLRAAHPADPLPSKAVPAPAWIVATHDALSALLEDKAAAAGVRLVGLEEAS